MDGLPNSGAATVILLMLATVAVTLLGAATAAIDLLLHARPTRLVHRVALILIVVAYGATAIGNPRTSLGLALGWPLGHIKDDFPILRATPFLPFLLLLAFSAPVIRRFRRPAATGPIR
jgi:hypothetical protein